MKIAKWIIDRLIAAVIIFGFLLIAAAAFGEEKSSIKPWGYFLFQYDTDTKSFYMPEARAYVDGSFGRFTFKVELKAQTNPLVRAQLTYKINEQIAFTVGQQSNPFKFYYPVPEEKFAVVTPLKHLRPNDQLDDLGISIQGKVSVFEYIFCVLNGAGANKADDNKDKDGVVLIKATPLSWFSLRGCWQGGWQNTPTRYYRTGWWIQGDIKPISKLVLKPTYIQYKNNVLNEDGWFLLGLYNFKNKHQLVLQYTKDKEKAELTFGAILDYSEMRFLPNITVRKVGDKFWLGLYVIMQLNINR